MKTIKTLYFALVALVIYFSAFAAIAYFEGSTTVLAERMIFAAIMLAFAGLVIGTILSCIPSIKKISS